MICVVPDGSTHKWSAFYAESFTPVWADGTVGIPGILPTGRCPTDAERKDIMSRIDEARKLLAVYSDKLVAARAKLFFSWKSPK